MKRALMIAPMGSLHKKFNKANINSLKSIGYEIHLLANFDVGCGGEKDDMSYLKQCEREGIIIHNMPFRRAVHPLNIRLLSRIRKLIYGGEFDLIHAHTETGGLLFRLAMIGKKNRYNAIYTPHGMSFYKGSSLFTQILYRPMEHWICSRMTYNLALNGEEMQCLERWNRKKARFIHGIGIPINSFMSTCVSGKFREEVNIPKNAILITSVGELNKNKNHKLILEAMHCLKNDNLYLVICGIGPEHDRLLKMAEKFGLKDRVKLVGFRSDIRNILNETDIFIFPSFHEGLPVSVMEAMTMGLPVICSDIRGNRDLIIENEGGCLFDPTSDEDLAAKIDSLIQNPIQITKMGKFNAERIKMYDISNVEKELTEIYSA